MVRLMEENRIAVIDACHRFKVRRLHVFGSAVKGNFHPASSDVDFLVSLEADSPAEYADNYFGLAEALEALLKRPVDIITERSIRNPYFRQTIEATRELVYEDRGEEASV